MGLPANDAPDEFFSPDGPPRRCTQCGYVLENIGDPGVCPECGKPFDFTIPMTFTRKPPFARWTFWKPGLLTALITGVVLELALIPLVGYGVSTTLVVPIVMGVLLGYRVQVGWLARAFMLTVLGASLLATIFTFNLAGGLCVLILAVLFAVPLVVGAFIGVLLRTHLKDSNFSQRMHLPILILIPVALAAFEGRHRGLAIVSTNTVATINATPEQTWRAIQFYEQVKHRPPLLLWASPSLRPMYTSGASENVGDRKVCVYERGRLVKEITEVVPGKRLAFRVVEQTDIENDGVRLIDGSFELTPTADGRGTVVTLTTRYEPKLAPRFAYLPAENLAVHTLHGHVLRGMKEDAETRDANEIGVGQRRP